MEHEMVETASIEGKAAKEYLAVAPFTSRERAPPLIVRVQVGSAHRRRLREGHAPGVALGVGRALARVQRADVEDGGAAGAEDEGAADNGVGGEAHRALAGRPGPDCLTIGEFSDDRPLPAKESAGDRGAVEAKGLG